MKYYKFKKKVWYDRLSKTNPIVDGETEKAYRFVTSIVDMSGHYRTIWIPKSICKVEDKETDIKHIEIYGDIKFSNSTLHIITFYIPKWFFGKNRMHVKIDELVDYNNCYDLEEVEMD